MINPTKSSLSGLQPWLHSLLWISLMSSVSCVGRHDSGLSVSKVHWMPTLFLEMCPGWGVNLSWVHRWDCSSKSLLIFYITLSKQIQYYNFHNTLHLKLVVYIGAVIYSQLTVRIKIPSLPDMLSLEQVRIVGCEK